MSWILFRSWIVDSSPPPFLPLTTICLISLILSWIQVSALLSSSEADVANFHFHPFSLSHPHQFHFSSVNKKSTAASSFFYKPYTYLQPFVHFVFPHSDHPVFFSFITTKLSQIWLQFMKFDIFFPVERTYDAMTLGCHRYLQVKESKIISLMSFKMVITYTRIYGFRNLKSILQSFLIASSFFSCFLCAPPPHPLLFFNLLKSPLFSNQLIDSIVSSCSLQFPSSWRINQLNLLFSHYLKLWCISILSPSLSVSSRPSANEHPVTHFICPHFITVISICPRLVFSSHMCSVNHFLTLSFVLFSDSLISIILACWHLPWLHKRKIVLISFGRCPMFFPSFVQHSWSTSLFKVFCKLWSWATVHQAFLCLTILKGISTVC